MTVRLVAVSDYHGFGTLFVPSVIKKPDLRWAHVVGSSRVGKLNPFPYRKAAAKVKVQVVSLDEEIGEHIRFLKIDTQVARDLIREARNRSGFMLSSAEIFGSCDFSISLTT